MWLAAELRSAVHQTADPFERIMAWSGTIYRALGNRKTQCVEHGGRRYFIKTHSGAGWKEIVKNFAQLRAPVLGARNEWRALERLPHIGIDTMTLVGYGQRGWDPARRRSFVITRDLGELPSLDVFGQRWHRQAMKRGEALKLKHALVREVARVARALHDDGINHRDFYLCHLLIDPSQLPHLRLHLIDLHRAQIRRRVPERWRVKDVGSLYFSSLELGLTRRDLFRFMRSYRDRPLRLTLREDARLWRRVQRRAEALRDEAIRKGIMAPTRSEDGI